MTLTTNNRSGGFSPHARSAPRGSKRRLPRGALSYFGEVARYGSIRQAADRLYVAASAVSRQVAKLEQAVGVPLFERRADGMHLTPAGVLLAGYLNRDERELHRALSAIDDLRGLSSGEVTVTTVEGMIDEFLPRVIETYRARFPAITFRIRVESALAVVEAVSADETDIGIGFNVPTRKNLVVAAKHVQPVHAVCSPRHPLAKSRRVPLKALGAYSLALQDSNFSIRRLVDDAFARARLPHESFLVTNSLLLLKSLVKQGNALTFLPTYAVRTEVGRGELVAIPTDSSILNSAHLDLCIHATRRLSPAAVEFFRLTQNELSKLRD
jgi:DNA-binding transcriptional LysR family regulator